MAVCIVGFFDLLRDGFAEPGTTARLNGELGAKPPLQSCKSIELDWTWVAVPPLPTGRESPQYQVKDVTTRAAVRRGWGCSARH